MATTAPTLPTATFDVLDIGTANVRPEADENVVKNIVEGFALPLQAAVADLPSGQELNFMFITGSGLPQDLPRTVNFGSLKDPRLQVLKPIPLAVSVEEGHVVVTWDAADEFGTGETLTGAVEDFAASLRQLYHHLHNDPNLGPDLTCVRRSLEEYIAPRQR